MQTKIKKLLSISNHKPVIETDEAILANTLVSDKVKEYAIQIGLETSRDVYFGYPMLERPAGFNKLHPIYAKGGAAPVGHKNLYSTIDLFKSNTLSTKNSTVYIDNRKPYGLTANQRLNIQRYFDSIEREL